MSRDQAPAARTASGPRQLDRDARQLSSLDQANRLGNHADDVKMSLSEPKPWFDPSLSRSESTSSLGPLGQNHWHQSRAAAAPNLNLKLKLNLTESAT